MSNEIMLFGSLRDKGISDVCKEIALKVPKVSVTLLLPCMLPISPLGSHNLIVSRVVSITSIGDQTVSFTSSKGFKILLRLYYPRLVNG